MSRLRRSLKRVFIGPPRPPSRKIERILVIRRNGLGDMICALPLIRSLKRAYPEATLTVLADRQNEPVARICEAVDEVLVFPLRRRILRGRTWQAWRTARELRKMNFDLAVGVSGSFSRMLARMVYGTGAGIRVGTIPPEMAEDPAYYTHFRIRPGGCRTHQIMTGVELMQSLSIPCDPDEMRLTLPEDDAADAQAWHRTVFRHSKPAVWLHLSNQRPESRWSPGKFKALAERLLKQTDANIVLARVRNDRHADPKPFKSLDPERVAWFENPSFIAFASALSRSRVVVCGDGGVMHLAAAVGPAVVALFSATEPDIWRPWGQRHKVLRRGASVADISVEEAFEAARTQLSL